VQDAHPCTVSASHDAIRSGVAIRADRSSQMSFEDVEQGGSGRAGWPIAIPSQLLVRRPMAFMDVGVGHRGSCRWL
jgi:hypothetical protein